MTEQELKEKIARKFLEYDFDRHGIQYGVLADEILALIKEAGFKSPEEVYDQTILQKKFMTRQFSRRSL